MLINPQQLSPPQTYFTMVQTVVPRPIAWVLSENPDGSNEPTDPNDQYNLAPFSYFNAVCSDPPLLMISISPQPDGRRKDTLSNIMARQRFVVHIAATDQLAALNHTSATLPPGVSEVTAAGITLTDQEGFALPRVAASPIAFMCTLHRTVDIGNSGQCMVLGEVTRMYIADECADTVSGRLKVDAARVRPLARLGASEYADFGSVLTMKRPD